MAMPGTPQVPGLPKEQAQLPRVQLVTERAPKAPVAMSGEPSRAHIESSAPAATAEAPRVQRAAAGSARPPCHLPRSGRRQQHTVDSGKEVLWNGWRRCNGPRR